MIRLACLAIAGTAATAVAAGAGPAAKTPDKGCAVTRVLKDGTEMKGAAAADLRNGTASSAAASVSRRGSGSSSASASSSSSSSVSAGGRGASRAVSTTTTTDSLGRTVTTVHDGRGCRITIDERD